LRLVHGGRVSRPYPPARGLGLLQPKLGSLPRPGPLRCCPTP